MRWSLLAMLAGCYSPSPPLGAPCSKSLLCPSGLVCDRGSCNATLSDASADAAPTCLTPPIASFTTPIRSSLSTSDFEGTPTETGDRLEIFYKSTLTSSNTDIYTATRASIADDWTTPMAVAELSSPAADESPEVSDDGLTIWLSSARGGGDMDIYTATRATRTSAWSKPVAVDELNSSGLDIGFTIVPSQLVAYLVSDRGTSGDYLPYRTTRPDRTSPWSTPTLVAELPAMENPAITVDDCTIYFQTGGKLGEDDLFFATRPAPGQPFGDKQPLTSISSGSDDDDPWISADQRYIIWASDRSGLGSYDLYESTR